MKNSSKFSICTGILAVLTLLLGGKEIEEPQNKDKSDGVKDETIAMATSQNKKNADEILEKVPYKEWKKTWFKKFCDNLDWYFYKKGYWKLSCSRTIEISTKKIESILDLPAVDNIEDGKNKTKVYVLEKENISDSRIYFNLGKQWESASYMEIEGSTPIWENNLTLRPESLEISWGGIKNSSKKSSDTSLTEPVSEKEEKTEDKVKDETGNSIINKKDESNETNSTGNDVEKNAKESPVLEYTIKDATIVKKIADANAIKTGK